MSFKVTTDNSKFDMSSKQAEIQACYRDLVKLFGEPLDGGCEKVSGEWLFEGENGELISVYDYKSTDLYDGTYPTVEEFREQDWAEFSIGGFKEEDVIKFNEWLKPQLQVKVYSFVSENEACTRSRNNLPSFHDQANAKI